MNNTVGTRHAGTLSGEKKTGDVELSVLHAAQGRSLIQAMSVSSHKTTPTSSDYVMSTDDRFWTLCNSYNANNRA